MLFLYEPLLNCNIQGQASIEVVTGGPNSINGVPGFPHVENVSLNLVYDEQGMPLNYDAYGSGATSSSDTYWADAGESYYMGMQGRPGGCPLRPGRCRGRYRGLCPPG